MKTKNFLTRGVDYESLTNSYTSSVSAAGNTFFVVRLRNLIPLAGIAVLMPLPFVIIFNFVGGGGGDDDDDVDVKSMCLCDFLLLFIALNASVIFVMIFYQIAHIFRVLTPRSAKLYDLPIFVRYN